MNKCEKLAELRHFMAHYGLPPDRPSIPLGFRQTDAVLGGGLRRGVLHEIFAGDWGAGGFAACLAIRTAGKKPLFWIAPSYEACEYGALSATGFLELGGDPDRLYLLSAANAQDALSAAADILSCPSVGGVVLELEGAPKILDLTASRRLGLLAEENGVTLFLLREGAHPSPSAAASRWDVQSFPSMTSDEDWGAPRFKATLTRNRFGALGEWIMEWNPDHGIFQEPAHSGFVAAAPSHRTAHASFAG